MDRTRAEGAKTRRTRTTTPEIQSKRTDAVLFHAGDMCLKKSGIRPLSNGRKSGKKSHTDLAIYQVSISDSGHFIHEFIAS